jgi:hypothetical protein
VQLKEVLIDALALAFANFRKDCGYLQFAGIWDAGATYERGSLVTDAGAMWLAMTDAKPGERPGKSVAWRMTVKSGDGK